MVLYEPPDNVVAAVLIDCVRLATTEARLKAVLRTWLRAELRRLLAISAEQADAILQRKGNDDAIDKPEAS